MSAALFALCGSWLVISPAATVAILRRRTGDPCKCPVSREGTSHYAFCGESR